MNFNKHKTLSKKITPKTNNISNAPKKKQIIKKASSSKINFKDEKEPEKEKEIEKDKTIEYDESDFQNNLKLISTPPSQTELDKELNIREDSYTLEEKKDNSSNNNTLTEKVDGENNPQLVKPFNKNGLLSKCHLKLATYIEQNKDVTLAGTKRFTDKSGEYYLKNVQLKKKKGEGGALSKKLSLRTPLNLENCFTKLNGNLNKIKRKATKIITVLPENSLTPIPVKEKNAVRGVAGIFNKKQYQNAERTAVFIRRMEYSSGVQKHLRPKRIENEDNINKIIIIQEWWKTMYKILRLQKCIRGFLFRRKLMKNLEHQERLLQFITEFDNIHGYHLYKTFFNNFKDLVNQIKSKRTEMLEDFSEKMEKIENLNYLKKLKNKFLEWKRIAEEEKKMDKAKDFYEKKLKMKVVKTFKKYHVFKKKIIKLIRKNLYDEKKKLLDILYTNKIKTDNNYTKGVSKLNKLFKNNDNRLKKETFDKMKLLDFLDHLSDLKDLLDDKHKKEFLKRLKKINDYYNIIDYFKNWKNTIHKKNIFKKLLKLKRKELENKKNLTPDSSNLDDKNQDDDEELSAIKPKPNEITISNESSINILKKESQKNVLSIGKPGLDFSIISPEIHNGDEGETSEKIPKIDNLNDAFDNGRKSLSMLNNEKMKAYFQKWKDLLYLKKNLQKLKEYKNKEKNNKNIQDKLLKIVNNKLKQKKFDGINNDNDLLEKAFYLWKNFELYYSKTQNFKKKKIKLIRKKDKNAQKNPTIIKQNNYVIEPLVNNFEIIAEKPNKGIGNARDNKNNKKNLHKNKEDNEDNINDDDNIDKINDNNKENINDNNLDNINNYNTDNINDNNEDDIKNNNNDNKTIKNPKNINTELKSQKKNDNLYNQDGDNDNEEINLKNIKICQNEPFTLERAYSENDDSIIDNLKNKNDEEDNNENNNKNKKIKARKRIAKTLSIQKDNSFSIINKKYINNKNDYNNYRINDLDEPISNKSDNYEYDDEEEREIFDDINEIKEINVFFPKENINNDKMKYLLEKIDNFILGPNSTDIPIDNINSNEELQNINVDNKKYNDKLFNKRKVLPYNNLEKCPVELFSIICERNKNDNGRNNSFNENETENPILNDINKKCNKEKDNDNDNTYNIKNKYFNNISPNKDNNDLLLDDINYKLYHAHKFTLWPKESILNKDIHSENEDESNKIIELPIMNNDEENNKKNLRKLKKKNKKPFKDISVQKDQSFSILRNKLNKLDNNKANYKDLDDNNNKFELDNLKLSKEDLITNKNKLDKLNERNSNNNDNNNNQRDLESLSDYYQNDERFENAKALLDKENHNFENTENLLDKDNINSNEDYFENKINNDSLKNENEDVNSKLDGDNIINKKNILDKLSKETPNENNNLYQDNEKISKKIKVNKKLKPNTIKGNPKNVEKSIEEEEKDNEEEIDDSEIKSYIKIKYNENNEENKENKDEEIKDKDNNELIDKDDKNKIHLKQLNRDNNNIDNQDEHINDEDTNELINNDDKNKIDLKQLNKGNNNIDNKKHNNLDVNDYNDKKDKNKEFNNDGNNENLKDKYNDNNYIINNKNNLNKYNKDGDENIIKAKINSDELNQRNHNEKDNKKENEDSMEEQNKNNKNVKKMPQYPMISTEKNDFMFGPSQNKKLENQIVKENDINIYNSSYNKKKQNENFSTEQQDIHKFDVLIETDISHQKKDDKNSDVIVCTINKSINPDLSTDKQGKEEKIEKVDNENQTLNDEYTISKQNKNQFTIYSHHNNKQLLFNKERTQFDSINSFSIKIDKKKINKNDLCKGIDTLRKVIKNDIFRNLMNLIKEKKKYDNKETMKNLIQKRDNNGILRKYFDMWNNPYLIRERTLKRVIENFFKKKINLKRILKDLSNNDNNRRNKNNTESKKFVLKHYLNKWKTIATCRGKNIKKRISIRKNLKKVNKNTKKNNRKNRKLKRKKEKKELLKKYFNKWKDNTLNSESIITYRKIINKITKYLQNKKEKEQKIEKEKENKNEALINKLKKAILQSLLRLYKEQKSKIIKKYFDLWRQKPKKINKYVKKIVTGSSSYKSQEKNLSNISGNISDFDSNSSNIKQYYPKKISKYDSIGKYKNSKYEINFEKIKKNIKNKDNGNGIDNYFNTDDSQKPEQHTYNPKGKIPKNISFGDLRSFPYNQTENNFSNNFDKIKKRSEKYYSEYQTEILDDTDINKQNKVVSNIQRIKNKYTSPNQSIISNTNSNNYNSNLNTYRSTKDILNSQSQNYVFQKKTKIIKSKKEKIEVLNKEIEEQKEQLSDDSSVNNSVLNGINLKESKVENLKPIIYTSQSFFIDKKSINLTSNQTMGATNEMSSVSFYKNPNNKYPMKMKGDFRKLIEKNPNILKQKNPRIQVTNATCQLEQFEQRNKKIFYKNDSNLLKLNPNLNIKNKYKKRELTKVVYNCDRDIYESQLPYETQKQSWISMSIPLNNDKAKWEFLNGVKGERHKNNANKFELIQKNVETVQTNKKTVKLIEKNRGLSKTNNSLSKIIEDSVEYNVQYDLKEMNYTQYYRSPINTSRRDRHESTSPLTVKLVKKTEKTNSNKRTNVIHHSRVSSVKYNTRTYNNINNINAQSGES